MEDFSHYVVSDFVPLCAGVLDAFTGFDRLPRIGIGKVQDLFTSTASIIPSATISPAVIPSLDFASRLGVRICVTLCQLLGGEIPRIDTGKALWVGSCVALQDILDRELPFFHAGSALGDCVFGGASPQLLDGVCICELEEEQTDGEK